jgi:hypothetical protein
MMLQMVCVTTTIEKSKNIVWLLDHDDDYYYYPDHYDPNYHHGCHDDDEIKTYYLSFSSSSMSMFSRSRQNRTDASYQSEY